MVKSPKTRYRTLLVPLLSLAAVVVASSLCVEREMAGVSVVASSHAASARLHVKALGTSNRGSQVASLQRPEQPREDYIVLPAEGSDPEVSDRNGESFDSMDFEEPTQQGHGATFCEGHPVATHCEGGFIPTNCASGTYPTLCPGTDASTKCGPFIVPTTCPSERISTYCPGGILPTVCAQGPVATLCPQGIVPTYCPGGIQLPTNCPVFPGTVSTQCGDGSYVPTICVTGHFPTVCPGGGILSCEPGH